MTNVPEATRVMFNIPIANYGKFAREIERLSKRSQKAGGWEITLLRFGTIEDKNTGAKTYEVFLDAPDARLEGYRFLARLDHSQETGNIIRMLPNIDVKELPHVYREGGPKCDHCQLNRARRDSFVLQKDEDGSFIQLGSSCMSDFFKTDPRAIAKLAEIVSYAREVAHAAQSEEYAGGDKAPRKLRDLRYIPLADFLLHCAAVVRSDGRYKQGFYKSESTKVRALGSLYKWLHMEAYEPTLEDMDTVDEALGWIEALADRRDRGENLNQYEHNVLVVGQASVIEGRSAGLAASIIGCYKRNLKPVAPVAPVAPPEPLVLDDMTEIMSLFIKAGSKLQYPKITISFDDIGEIVLSVAGPSSQYPGTVNVCSTGGYGHNTWYGRIHKDGRFEANRRKPLVEALEKALLAFAADPAGVAAAYGKRSGNCCLCNRPLKDARSVASGYGRTCARNWQLPWGAK